MSRLMSAALLALALIGADVTFGADPLATKTFQYTTTPQGELSLTAYFPADWAADQQRPAIVFFFGGGWTKGSVKQFEPQSQYLAGRGMVAICADYRVKSRHGVTPDECVQDARSAIHWVREHAGELAIDPQRIVGAGGSAGGHLAACTGICPEPDASDEPRDASSIPNALVLFNPVLNFNQPKLTERLKNDESRALAISPTRHLRRKSPPTLLLYGANDPLLAQGKEFLTRSKELGHTAELFSADGVGHGFFNRPPWRDRTLERVDAFLVAQGYLNRIGK